MIANFAQARFKPGTAEENERGWRAAMADLQSKAGFRGAYLFVDPQTNDTVSVQLWDTVEQFNAIQALRQQHVDKLRPNIDTSVQPASHVYEVRGQV